MVPAVKNDDVNVASRRHEMGIFATICLLIGLALLGVTVLSALNTAFGWNLALGVSGTTTPLPKHWDAVIGLGAVSILIIALTYFGSTVARMYRQAQGKPLVRVGIIGGALLLLVAAGRGLQIMALVSTYGSMLAYYCTDEGTLADVEGELAKGPSPEALDRCLGRTAQWDRHDLLDVVIGAGANFKDESSEPEFRSCVLNNDVSVAYFERATALGATPETCPNSEDLIASVVSRARAEDDEETAKKVALLVAAGWRADVPGEFSKKTAAQEAEENQLPKTLAALAAAPAR